MEGSEIEERKRSKLASEEGRLGVNRRKRGEDLSGDASWEKGEVRGRLVRSGASKREEVRTESGSWERAASLQCSPYAKSNSRGQT